MDYYIQVMLRAVTLVFQYPDYFQESGEYVPMIHQDACDISAKIKLLNYIKKDMENELD